MDLECKRRTAQKNDRRKQMRTLVSIIAGTLALGGCASSQTPSETPPPAAAQPAPAQASPAQAEPSPASGESAQMMGGTMSGGMASTCPMNVEGTSVLAEDSPQGTTLVFTTTGDVAGLRQRVARMAQMYNQHQRGGHGMMMQMTGGRMHGQGGGGMMQSNGTQGQGGGMMQGGGMQGQGGAAQGGGTMMQGGTMHGAQQTTPAEGSQQGGGTMMQGGGMQGGGMMMMPPSTARVEEVEGGARLVLTVTDAAQLQALQQHAKRMAQRMGSHQCPMMTPASQPAPAPESPQQQSSQGDNP
jgi:hypothetical protein